MVENFLRGGAAVNVLARAGRGARGRGGLRRRHAARRHAMGSSSGASARRHRRHLAAGPAMTREQALAAIEAGAALAEEAIAARRGPARHRRDGHRQHDRGQRDHRGDHRRAGRAVTGRGTGVDDAGWRARSRWSAARWLVNRPDPADALDVLAKVGGFEIAGLVGVDPGRRRAAACRSSLDGFIAGAAALVAVALAPARAPRAVRRASLGGARARAWRSRHLGLTPYLDLGMRLGEGTGAALCIGLGARGGRDLSARWRRSSRPASRSGARPMARALGAASPRSRWRVLCALGVAPRGSRCGDTAAATSTSGRRLRRPAHRVAGAERDRDHVRPRRAGPAGRASPTSATTRPAAPAEAQRGRDGDAEPRGDRGAPARPRRRHDAGNREETFAAAQRGSASRSTRSTPTAIAETCST